MLSTRLDHSGVFQATQGRVPALLTLQGCLLQNRILVWNKHVWPLWLQCPRGQDAWGLIFPFAGPYLLCLLNKTNISPFVIVSFQFRWPESTLVKWESFWKSFDFHLMSRLFRFSLFDGSRRCIWCVCRPASLLEVGKRVRRTGEAATSWVSETGWLEVLWGPSCLNWPYF